MIRRVAICLSVTALTACQYQPPEISEVMPPPGPPANETVVDFTQTYGTAWSCEWNNGPGHWKLPGVKVVHGHAYSLNDSTRLSGKVARAAPPQAGELTLRGGRRDGSGIWHEMVMSGPIFAGRESVLHGYWKDGTCQVTLTPLDAAPSHSAGLS